MRHRSPIEELYYGIGVRVVIVTILALAAGCAIGYLIARDNNNCERDQIQGAYKDILQRQAELQRKEKVCK